ncbi:ArnT family glycosyltransferase [Hymenobacter sediminicola]|uniref:Glycosyltransferase family 39 protein n=1 Tax=Hymenobacter sediminicola TaxID=2761579 RepID=A0A7G7W6X9_9BACT|nr:glycosyltransferase family 39 protein [Hymenobacter sediminicola]QNH62122.1 glycosyltransferase family 39 protein [Hymenobacter sediminicola]
MPIALWDESRLAVNAAEMLNNGNWLVTHFDGKPDLWNAKPPLLIWIQASLFWLFGMNEVTLRLPSALAGLATAGLLAWFGVRVLRSPLVGLFSALVLLTTSGYIDRHITRTGDYDTLLVFFTTWYVLSFYRYLEEGHRRSLWHTGIGITLAILTKSVVGAFFLPALLLYTIATRKLLPLLRQRDFYIMAAGILVAVALYYVPREFVSPGYWQAVYDNELGGRLGKSEIGLVSTWTWYLDMLIQDELLPWLYVYPIGFFALLHPAAPPKYRRLALLLVICVAFLLTVISYSATKYFWYEAPIYPLCALVAGAGLAVIAEVIVTHLRAGSRPWAVILFIVCVFAWPAKIIWDECFYNEYESDTLFGKYIRHQAKEYGQIDSYTLLTGLGYDSSMLFSRLAAMREYDHTVRVLYYWQILDLRQGETVIVCNPKMRTQVDSLFQTNAVFEESPCATLLLLAPKVNR